MCQGVLRPLRPVAPPSISQSAASRLNLRLSKLNDNLNPLSGTPELGKQGLPTLLLPIPLKSAQHYVN